jgi:hypothetical protein
LQSNDDKNIKVTLPISEFTHEYYLDGGSQSFSFTDSKQRTQKIYLPINIGKMDYPTRKYYIINDRFDPTIIEINKNDSDAVLYYILNNANNELTDTVKIKNQLWPTWITSIMQVME